MPATRSVTEPSYDDYPKESLTPGGILKLRFPERPEVYINDQLIPVFAVKQKNDWLVLIPFSLYKGAESIRMLSKTKQLLQLHLIDLKEANYQEQHIRVKNKEFVRASKKTLERIQKESKLKWENYQRHTRAYIKNFKMIKPLDVTLRGDFGRKRFFNGVAKNPHAGIDLSGRVGDKIKAPLSGTAIVLGDMFYNGNMLLLDHGEGLITAYSHLSKIYLENEQWVRQGEYIGEVGQSGRVTGPHLHWSVYLNAQPVNPELFLDLR